MDFIRVRAANTPSVRVFNPSLENDGWESNYTAVQIATNDMPFLVDSVGIAAHEQGLALHGLIHPVYFIARDPGGNLLNLALDDASKGKPESVMHLEVDRLSEPAEMERLQKAMQLALHDVAAAVADWPAMKAKMLEMADNAGKWKLPLDAAGVADAQEFLRWAGADHFTFLGYREYHVVKKGDDEVLEASPKTGLGILRGGEKQVAPRSLKTLVSHELRKSGTGDAVILTKTNARSTVHRGGYMDYIGVLEFDDKGMPTAEHRFLGLYASGAYTRRPWEIPLVRQKYEAVMDRAGYKRDSHSGKTLRNILETLPREELFQSSENELFDTASGVMHLQGRARSRLFVRRDKYGRFFSCLVFVPRERFNTDVRERIEALLKRAFHGERVDSSVQMGESPLARVHLVIRPKPGDKPTYDVAELEAKIGQIVRNWHDELRETLVKKHGEDKGSRLANRYGRALPAGYIEEVSSAVAAADVEAAASLKNADDIRLNLYRSRGETNLRFKLFRYGAPITLTEVLPMLENMGMKVLSEHPYEMHVGDTAIVIQDFEVQPAGRLDFDLDTVRDTFQQSFERIWRGQTESDGFNKLILGANLDWRQVAMLRGVCKYLLQAGVPFSQSYMEETLNRYPLIAAFFVVLFETKFDPARDKWAKAEIEQQKKRLQKEIDTLLPGTMKEQRGAVVDAVVATCAEPREEQYKAAVNAVKLLLDQVASLDEDRILRAYLGVIGAMLRTSYFQTPEGKHREYISFKFDPSKVPDLPKPRPYREIFVYAPRVEAVHLRFGPVARGGLRWSDRREDFRTEVLGLVKAQMVKNTVIVPVGSKGGFFVKRPPLGGDRDAQLAEGIACYRLFMNAMLDITDNLVDGKVVNPQNCVRHDADDPYLVVAADKGTATFSDIANAISLEHDFWLGDAFASGGSVGYDHKAMGITAKGAWESVKRHFRALGRDSQSQDFTCAGIGDMSGDVFGNGMLLSKHIRLVAAFDHRHIFLDPNPDAARTFPERERMFKLPRSSWADYDAKLISKGGGIYPLTAKSIPVSPEVRVALGIDDGVEALSPNDLKRAILKAPVDLLWNGGIGTYVKAEVETNADVGDRANNAIRINGKELRSKLIGEGGNLGFTQRGRIEAALNGVLLNTDFIDNSAGVDTSDHEVNIKILLGDAVQRGELTMDQRNKQLAAMTDEVERLVLADNYR
ncbi:NAD-glutamate dehydrogenase, partial [Rudaea sp.]|uniref:NAD-glutamate dehydrogenase n=1 Tax=Rudaea sp. TaxID=2136325 RepID=UPI00321F6C28